MKHQVEPKRVAASTANQAQVLRHFLMIKEAEYTDPSKKITAIPQVASIRPVLAAAYVGIAMSSLWDRINPSSPRYDQAFPKPIKLSERSRAFLVAELDAWLAMKAGERTKGALS